VARFDRRGLWSCQGARFSRFGTLMETARRFIEPAFHGYTASALREELAVEVKTDLPPISWTRLAVDTQDANAFYGRTDFISVKAV